MFVQRHSHRNGSSSGGGETFQPCAILGLLFLLLQPLRFCGSIPHSFSHLLVLNSTTINRTERDRHPPSPSNSAFGAEEKSHDNNCSLRLQIIRISFLLVSLPVYLTHVVHVFALIQVQRYAHGASSNYTTEDLYWTIWPPLCSLCYWMTRQRLFDLIEI